MNYFIRNLTQWVVIETYWYLIMISLIIGSSNRHPHTIHKAYR